VVGLEDRFSLEDAPRWLPLEPHVVKTMGPGAFGYSPDLLGALDPKADLLYAPTLWKYPSWVALQWAERTGKPMMVAPHGSLDPWALSNAAWKKRVASLLFKNRQLHKASCIRALCQSESEAIRAYGLANPISIIPNGVNLPEGDLTKTEAGERKTLLFLGRIHPKKGLTNALRAFKKALDSRPSTLNPSWQFVIAGWDQNGHQRELMQMCQELGLKSEKLNLESAKVGRFDSEVVFYGPAFKEEKEALLRSADAFILPSLSEGLPMSVLEAWAYELPVVMTPECNLPEGFAADAAIQIETDAPSIAHGLNGLFSMNEADLNEMGRRGRELVKQRFSWQTVATQMKEVYDWMLGGGDIPSSVIK
jgi:poly(glycerol-phosphate) alpha-glucosyltransferase